MTEELETRSYGPWVIALVVVGLGMLLYFWPSGSVEPVPTDLKALRDAVGTNEPGMTDPVALAKQLNRNKPPGEPTPGATDLQALRDAMNQ